VLDHAIDPTISQSWIPSSARRGLHLLEQNSLEQSEADFLDRVPVMLATVLGLDLLLRDPRIDLRLVSNLILSDVGATIHILGLVGREYDAAEYFPTRMGDCIASLDVCSWFGAVSARTFSCDQEHLSTTIIWSHCRVVAQYAQLVAESLDDISPEDAYMVGLLHEMGAIATVLGWPRGDGGAMDPTDLFAAELALPPFVLAVGRAITGSRPSSTWRSILTTAHELAGGEMDFDSSALQCGISTEIRSGWRRHLPA
jgi:hypothetical protein